MTLLEITDAHSEPEEATSLNERPVSNDRLDRMITPLGFAVTVVVAVAFWIPMLTRRLGVDETLTAWIVSGSFEESITRSGTHQGQSPLYFAGLWVWQSVFGDSASTLRIPSLIALALSVWQLRRFGESILDRRAGTIAAIVLIGTQLSAADARPYSFLVLGTIMSVRLGYAWSLRPSHRGALRWSAAAAFTLAMHPLAIWTLVPQLVFAVRGGRAGARVMHFVVLVGSSVLFVSPMIPQILNLQSRQSTLVIAPMPNVIIFVIVVFLFQATVCLALSLFVCRTFDGRKLAEPGVLFVVVLWSLLPSTALFAQSHITGNSVFVDRYMIGAVPGMALAIGIVLSKIKMPVARIIGLGAFVIACGVAMEPVPSHDWSTAVVWTNTAAGDPVMWTMTGYVELADMNAFPLPAETNEYLNAPLLVHGATGELRSIPLEATALDRAEIGRAVSEADRRPVLLLEFVRNLREAGPVFAEESLVAEGYVRTKVDDSLGVRSTLFMPPN